VGARVVGLLLAAGRGRRFAAARAAGAEAPVDDKLLAPVDGVPVARRALHALRAGCDAVVAVVRPDGSPALRVALAGARIVECPDADLGMGHSLATATRAAIDDGADAVLVMPADMPWLAPAKAGTVAEAAREGGEDARAVRIVVPVLPDGRRGHPVAFGAAHLPALARLSGDRGARALLEAFPLRLARVDDAGILRDVDTPRDLPPS
jgi:molybdenum cofactor cytidylyltransferase